MKPVLVSFDGNNINDGTNYDSQIPYGIPQQAATANARFVKRAGATPVYAGKEISESQITIFITCKGTVAEQLETINKWFNIYDEEPKILIIKDTDDSDKQYQIYCTPVSITGVEGSMKAKANQVKVTLARKDPVWRSVTQNSTSWSITATGQTQAITNNGNIEAYPTFEFTPTSYPSGGYGYSRKVLAYPTSLYAFPNRPLEIFGGLDTAALVASASISNQINVGGGISAAATSWAIDTSVGGGLPTTGGAFYVDSEQCTYTSISAGTINGVTRGVGGTTAATHADNAVMKKSVILANGNDVRVLVNGREVDRWFGDSSTAQINQTATKCWIAIDMPPKREAALKTAISNVGTPSEIEVTYTTANYTAAARMPKAGRLLIDSEEFSYTGKTLTTTDIKFTGIERALRNTSAASHAVDATIRWIPFDIQVAYGNLSATAPVIDNTKKPVINLATSTNSSFVYANFYDITEPVGLRAGAWKPSVLAVSNVNRSVSDVYYGTNYGTDTDPAEVMGMRIASFVTQGINKADSAEIQWLLSIPDAVSNVDSAGSKYRNATNWFTVARLQSSVNGALWVDEWAATEATPGSLSTWTSWTYNETVPNTTRFLRYYVRGTSAATASKYMAFETTSATLTLVNYPTVSLRSEQSNYYVDVTLTNTTTGKYIKMTYPMQTSETLYIDTDPNQPYAKKNGQLVNVVNPSTNRSNWLPLTPGSNTLTVTLAVNSNITLVVKHYDRMNFV